MESILLFITNFINNFSQYAQENPVVAGAISLWGLGTFSYFARDIPSKIGYHIKKQCTTSLSILSTCEAFHNFLNWYSEKGYCKRLRAFKISSGRYGDEEAKKSVGYGTHFFMYGLRPGMITLNQKETHANMERDQIDITVVGRSAKIYDNIFKEIRDTKPQENQLVVNKYDGDYWERAQTQRKRSLNTIFLNKGVKEEVLQFLDNFQSLENWYIQRGLSYQTGIIFYGPPGCGKTSLVKALASHYGTSLYILPTSLLGKISKAVMELPERSVLLIEDLDTDDATRKRNVIKPRDKKGRKKDDEDPPFVFTWSNLSDILNTIDGIVTNHGRIMIATTNHIDKLDDAILRSGRFDLKVKLDYADSYVARQFMHNFFPGQTLPAGFKLKEKTTAADIQVAILENLDNPAAVIKKIKK